MPKGKPGHKDMSVRGKVFATVLDIMSKPELLLLEQEARRRRRDPRYKPRPMI